MTTPDAKTIRTHFEKAVGKMGFSYTPNDRLELQVLHMAGHQPADVRGDITLHLKGEKEQMCLEAATPDALVVAFFGAVRRAGGFRTIHHDTQTLERVVTSFEACEDEIFAASPEVRRMTRVLAAA